MKKLLALLNTPARAVIAVGLVILIAEFLIMALFDVIRGAFPTRDDYQWVMIFNYLDPILLIAIVAPTLYILIFRPMRNQQDELEVARRKIEQAFQGWIAALDVIDDSVFLHDKQFRILRCNKAYQQRAGIPFHEIIGQPYYEIFPKTGAPLPCCLRALGKEEEAEAEELAVGEASYRSRAFSIKDEQGVYLYSVHILEDITERKKAEQTLIKSEALLNEMGRLAKVGGWEFNVETREVVWTEEVYRIHELDMAYKPTVDKGIEFYAPASRPIIARVVQRAIEYGEPYDVELELITAKGNYRWVHTNGKVFQKHGKTITVFGTFQDITERKQAEAQLAEQFEELRRWHEITSGREKRILVVKHEVNELLAQAGQPPRYPSAELSNTE